MPQEKLSLIVDKYFFKHVALPIDPLNSLCLSFLDWASQVLSKMKNVFKVI